MTPRWGCRLALTVCTLTLILGGAPKAETQTTVPDSAFNTSHQPAVIKHQLQMAAQFGRRVLASLHAASPDDATPIDDYMHREARYTYGFLRSARHGMGLQKSAQKFPDPVLDLTYKRVTRAWDLARIPVDRLCCLTRQQYLAEAIPAMTESMRLLEQVLVMIP